MCVVKNGVMEPNLSVTKPACFEDWLTMIEASN